MAVYSAEAVVLRKVDYGEADRILTLFTLERGKVPAIAKGVRKARAKMLGQLDVFSHGKVMLAEGRNMDVVTQFQRVTRSSEIAADLPRSAAAAVVIEVADKVLEERHPQPELFTIVVGALGRLSQDGAGAGAELADYLTRVLAELGYAPALVECARCGRRLEGQEGMGFSPLAGGVVCAECNRVAPAASISTRVVKILRVLASGDRELFDRLRLDSADIDEVLVVLEAQLEHHLDRQLKSIDFARRVRATRAR